MKKRIDKYTFISLLVFMFTSSPSSAERQGPHAVGDMYTTALNMLESKEANEASDNIVVEKMHINHGQVLLDITVNGSPKMMIYDPIAHKIFINESQN